MWWWESALKMGGSHDRLASNLIVDYPLQTNYRALFPPHNVPDLPSSFTFHSPATPTPPPENV